MQTTRTRGRPALSTARRRRRAAHSTADVRSGGAAALAVAALPFALVLGLAAFDGGYYAPAWGWCALALAWATLVAALGRRDTRVSADAIAWAGLVAALGGWIWLSATWSISSTLTLLDGQRVLAYVCAAAFVALAVKRTSVRPISAAVLAATTIVTAYAVLRYGSTDGSAMAEPIGYSNALGLLAVMGLLLALGFAADGGAARSAAVAAAVPLGACVYLTYSRGALVALAVGLVAMATLATGKTRRLAVASALGGIVVLAVLAGRTAATSASLGTTLRGDVLTLATNDRDRYWAAAWQTFLDHPLLGSGAGTFERTWLLYRDVNLGVLDAHSLYLETLAELGPIGLVLLDFICVLPLVAAWRSRSQPLVPAVAGAYVAYLIHAAVDWDWEMPVLTLTAFLFAGVLVAGGSDRSFQLTARARTTLVGVVSLIGVVAFVGLIGNSALTAAVVDLEGGSPKSAEREARHARSWSLWSAEPERVLAVAAATQGDRRAAREHALAALRRDPGNVRLWRLLWSVSPADRMHAFQRITTLDPHGPPPWAP